MHLLYKLASDAAAVSAKLIAFVDEICNWCFSQFSDQIAKFDSPTHFPTDGHEM